MRAEMAEPDMKLPIQLALAWPERLPTGVAPAPARPSGAHVRAGDREAFPAVDLAYRVGGLGLTFPAAMNAANEVAVMAFLEGKIPLTRIVEIVADRRGRARARIGGLGRAHRAGRRMGPPARRRDHRGAVGPGGVSRVSIVLFFARPRSSSS